MKRFFIITIFLGFSVLIGFSLFNMKKKMDLSNEILRVAFPYKKDITYYEPTRIHFAPEYIFLENTFSPLIELSKDNGAPIASIAKSFYWVDNELHFEIRDDLYTVDGYKITAKDAEFSLKRLLILSENTHGNLKDLICSGKSIKSMSEPCKGIEASEGKLILKPSKKTPFILKMLAAIDFAILPIPSIDPETLQIKDYRNTSGPYYVEEDDGQGNILLVANKKHFHFDKAIPQKIQLIPSGIDGIPDALTQFKEGKVDFITTIDKLSPLEIIKFSKKEPNSELHKTLNIRTYVAVYTDKATKSLSIKKRISIGKALKKAFKRHYQSVSEYKLTDQFFPSYGDGGLTKDQSDKLHEIYENTEGYKVVRGFIFPSLIVELQGNF